MLINFDIQAIFFFDIVMHRMSLTSILRYMSSYVWSNFIFSLLFHHFLFGFLLIKAHKSLWKIGNEIIFYYLWIFDKITNSL